MTLVVDASVAVRWLLSLDRSDRAEALLRSGERLIAPDFIMVEVTNAVWKSVGFGSTNTDVARTLVSEAERHFDGLVPAIVLKDRALALALELRHPAYDCFYLALAQQRNAQLVTADDRLLRRCAGTPFAGLVKPL